jgi:hypothetical protein
MNLYMASCQKRKTPAATNSPSPPLLRLPHLLTSEVVYFFFGNFGSPILSPRRMTLSTLSIVPSSFWSGAAVPRSMSATTVGVVLHLVARSFCVMVLPLSFLAFDRAVLMASPTFPPTVLGLTMSSDRSTLVRCWPSTAGFWEVSAPSHGVRLDDR